MPGRARQKRGCRRGGERTFAHSGAKVDESPRVLPWPAEDVAGLDIPVHPASSMQQLQPRAHVDQHLRKIPPQPVWHAHTHGHTHTHSRPHAHTHGHTHTLTATHTHTHTHKQFMSCRATIHYAYTISPTLARATLAAERVIMHDVHA